MKNKKQTGTRIWVRKSDIIYNSTPDPGYTIGYCLEEPIEVLKRLFSGYAILKYRGVQLLGSPVVGPCDLRISGFSEADRVADGCVQVNPTPGTSITGTIDDLLPELSEMRRRKELSSDEVAQVLQHEITFNENCYGAKRSPARFKEFLQWAPWYKDLKSILREMEK